MNRLLTTALVGTVGALALTACTGHNGEHSRMSQPAAMTAAQNATTPTPGTVAAANNGTHVNPLFTTSPLPFHAPRFNKIEPRDFKPAILKGMAEQMKEVQTIADNPEAPTFQNTIVALEKTGQDLNHALRVFSHLASANTNDTLRATQRALAPKLAAHHDAIFLDQKLWKRVKTIWNKRDKLDLDHADSRLLWHYHEQFVHAGANLSDKDRAKLKDMNKELASLSTSFVQTLMDATKHGALVVHDKSRLAGLSDAKIKAAAQLADKRGLGDNTWVIALENTTRQGALTSLKNREVRKELFMHSWNRAAEGKYSTRDIIAKMAKLRAEKAALLGFPNFAAWKLVTQMAKTPENVTDFLGKLVGPTKATAHYEESELQKIAGQNGQDFKLKRWDWQYFAEKLRQKKYAIDQSKIKPYFELQNVLENGVFYAAHLLYGISFKERHDLPVWAPDVHVYEVYDKDGSPLALFYTDYFKRDNKNGGAWMSELVGQSKLRGTKPVVYNVANFPKPASGEPALLTFDQVTTVFHEFGHALNGFFSNVEYPSLSGTARARDFVEFPSQFNEHWALYPKVFKHYAVNYKTGKPMPESLREKIMKAKHFNAGFNMTELIAAAELDMQWHMLPASAPQKKPGKFGPEALKKVGIYMKLIPPRYRSSYFMHIWGNGYSAGYYAYLWTEMLADDGYQWFLDHGGLTRENGDRYRKLVLSRGSSVDPAKMWQQFYGGEPEIGPMLKYRGLAQHSDAGENAGK